MNTSTPPADLPISTTMQIVGKARQYQLPEELVVAIARHESSLNRWAMKYEPGYRYLWNCVDDAPHKIGPADAHASSAPSGFPSCPGLLTDADTEFVAQRTSYGVMQVMGAVAREYGFRGYLSQLCDVQTSCDIACRHLSKLATRFHAQYGWAGVIAAYNAGSPVFANGRFTNQDYVDAVARAGAAALINRRAGA